MLCYKFILWQLDCHRPVALLGRIAVQIQLKDMSHATFESDDGVLCQDQIGSPLMDQGKSGGSADGGLVLKKGPWTSAEDAILVDYVKKHGEGNWNAVQRFSGLSRCGKSCRLRWANHLRPNLKKGAFSAEEERLIVELHAKMGNKWARMAAHVIALLPYLDIEGGAVSCFRYYSCLLPAQFT